MKTQAYPHIYEMLESQLWGRGLGRFSKSQLCEPVEYSPAYQREISNLEVHSPNARQLLRESLPRMATEVIQRAKRPIYIPAHYQHGSKKSRILCYRRTYLAYKFYGDWYYQHFDGIGPEVGELMLQNVRANRQRVQRQERILELAIRQLVQRSCNGADVDWDALVAQYIKETAQILP
jgi:hypothetical protein